MVSLGVLSSVCELVEKEFLAKGMEKVLGESKKQFLPLNLKALESGCGSISLV